MLFTRCLPRSSNGLANITATLGSFYWLGFETSGLSPDKKRLALLGAQQYLFVSHLTVISDRHFGSEKIRFSLLQQGNSQKTVRISRPWCVLCGLGFPKLIYGRRCAELAPSVRPRNGEMK